jgi:hypothetical protein
MFAGISLVLALADCAQAEPAVPFTFETRVVTRPQVEVRSGPSPSPLYYSTTVLKTGDTVQVVTNKKDVPAGWLAIKPPAGSFSWVSAKHVTLQNANVGIVHETDTPVLVGSRMDNRPPNVKSTVLGSGSLVAILDKPLVASDGTRWLPIEPYQTEVRYIPEDAIRPATPVQATAAKPAAPNVGLAGPVISPDPLWSQAQNAEAEGHVADAESLYQRLAAQTTDRALQERCYARLTSLQQRANGAAKNPTTTASWTGPAQTAPSNPVSASTAYRPAATGGYGPTPPTAAPQTEQYSGWGYLFKAGFEISGKQAYRLTSNQNQHVCYIIAQPGFNLDPYVNRLVNLYGTPGYCSETIRATYIAARYAYTQPPQ